MIALIGQDSHRFSDDMGKPCVIGGVIIPGCPGMDADSDGDVVFHAICNALTSYTHVPILGGIAIQLCKEEGITDSSVYLQEALKPLKAEIVHISITIEGARPRLQKEVDAIRASVAKACEIDVSAVGMTVTSGDGLTGFGKGEGLMCYAIVNIRP